MWTKSGAMNRLLEVIAHKTTVWVGSSWAFLLAFVMTVVWMATGPIYHFNEVWQLVMNTISSVVTFLMVFLLQRSQNKDALAIQVKLNELIAATRGASNRLINIEEMTEEELEALHGRYQKLLDKVARDGKQITAPVSIEQAAGDGRGAAEPFPVASS